MHARTTRQLARSLDRRQYRRLPALVLALCAGILTVPTLGSQNPQGAPVQKPKGQKIFIVGEVRRPGAYTITGEMRLVEALALAGSTLPTASGEAVLVRTRGQAQASRAKGDGRPVGTAGDDAGPLATDSAGDANGLVYRVNLRDLENGVLAENVALESGDTVFVLRAENIFVFGQVRNPGAYPLQPNATVLQVLSLAGGITDRGSTSRIQIVRVAKGEKKEIKAKLTDLVQAGDTVIVPERFF